MTESKAVLSDALESIVNVVAAIVTLIVIKISIKPADKDHPYGHGKAEYFSMAFEGGFITFAGLVICLESARALVMGHSLRHLENGIYIVLFCGLANGILGFYLKQSGKKLNSMALVASGQHILTDFLTSVGVAVGLFLVNVTGKIWIDPAIAILFASYLLYTGFTIVRQSFGGLMDAEDVKIINEIAKLFEKYKTPGIIRIHHTRVMRSGNYHHIDAHVVLPEYWDITKAHNETDKFESKVITEYHTDGEIHFHLDPCRRFYCRACEMSDCKIRVEPFQKRIPFTLEELVSPTEPEDFRK
jgi:cation diffusion facilitator family transporter